MKKNWFIILFIAIITVDLFCDVKDDIMVFVAPTIGFSKDLGVSKGYYFCLGFTAMAVYIDLNINILPSSFVATGLNFNLKQEEISFLYEIGISPIYFAKLSIGNETILGVGHNLYGRITGGFFLNLSLSKYFKKDKITTGSLFLSIPIIIVDPYAGYLNSMGILGIY